ncbi:2-amino-3,7-dideoxy-D-threo-hept-6-ulosonate synthase [Desulfobotulus mexicanus]|uniref:2-amino-3,7-dideoxy-D-threo-hept-6-ulosonate synthase n=1 Tax=Desulfobotulus mexicanus TaxID=2586642 RepID=A0A5S5MDR0_9BACT|nr:2-amino-3,7-dideoxy-D-threo-hept-6-ulosonate synthase [Desulfobotulus mexicanus]TYT73876.1 class I fructose-bisphosphate aldolase family protein [Desulfobotulus mexicanus]
MQLGKQVRLERIFDRNTKKTIIVPMDHGVTVGPIPGMIDLRGAVDKVAEGGANAVLMHKGLPRRTHRGHGRDIGLILHLSASTSLSPFSNTKTLVATVEDGLRLGADAVSVHVNVGDENERAMLRDFGEVSTRANEWGMPVLAMVYARGPRIADENHVDVVKHCARLGEELGADVVKVAYTGSPETFRQVVDGCCIPVVIAGGPKMENDAQILQMAFDAMQAGAAGLSLGRNVFQHENPTALLRALHGIVNEGMEAQMAMERYLN